MVFVPLHDDNHLKFIPFQATTWSLIAINVAVFLWQLTIGGEAQTAIDYGAGVIPASLLGDAKLPPDLVLTRPEFTLVTYMFLHGDIWHLLGNMMFLWVFGDDVEAALGRFRYLIFYFLCGAAGALAHFAANPASHLPLLGASGAVAGIVAAYLMLHPCRKIWVLAFMRIPVKIAAEWALGFWILVQILNILFSTDETVAWWTHIGGLVAGAALVIVMRPPGVKLFDCDQDRLLEARQPSNTLT